MQLRLYQFSKAPNSTKLPDSGGISVSGELNAECSVGSPSVAFTEANSASDLTTYNYAYIPAFHRYYTIRDWTYRPGRWIASMSVDVLASFKDVIGASTQYVLRSASQWDGRIIDKSYPTIAESSGSTSSSWIASPWLDGGSSYVVGIKGSQTEHYVFSSSTLSAFFSYIWSDLYADQYLTGEITELFPAYKALINPMQYISSVTWFPFNAMGGGGTVHVGWGTVPYGDQVTGNGLVEGPTASFEIPRHPQSALRGTYLNLSPYSRYTLFYPPFGMVALDSTILCNVDSVDVQVVVDLRTGGGTMYVRAGDILLSKIDAQIGVTVQFTQIVSSGFGVGNVAMTGAQASAAILAGNYAGAASTVMTAIGDAVEGMIPHANSVGSSGGVNGLYGEAGLMGEFVHITEEDLPHRGRPLCKRVQISTLSGYTLVANAEVEANLATADELDRIISLMEGGFLYE